MKNLACFIFFITVSIATFSQQPQKRIALVIGSQNYTVLPKLRNSLNDAKAITTTLQAKGFQVKSLYDPKTRTEIKDGINWYFNQMRDQEGAVGLIFYAGHGMQYHGDNYIIPTTASLQNPSDLEDYCVKMNGVMEIINSASKSLNILLLDACRSLPSFTRGSDQGLSKMSPPEGSIIVFATTAGKVADDGTGTHGLFTSKLLKAMNEPGLNINDVFRKVQREVYAESKKQQLPELDDLAVGGDFYFTPGNKAVVQTTQLVQDQVVKAETVYEAPTIFDYGYGTDDASTVTVGSQTWISKNLNIDHFANGDLIPEAKADYEWRRAGENKQPAWCYYKNDLANGRTYGKLYNWYAVTDPRGLAPTGWHVPSQRELFQLITYLGGKETAGLSLKSTSGWIKNGNGNNSSGIAGLPSGSRENQETFLYLGEKADWWSTSELSYNTEKAVFCLLPYNIDEIFWYAEDKGFGFSVRCIKD